MPYRELSDRALGLWLALIIVGGIAVALMQGCDGFYPPLTPVASDSTYRRWYAQGATCLGVTQPYDTAIRYYIGTRTPSHWNATITTPINGYADLASRSILLVPAVAHDSAIVLHEQLHLMLRDGAHPPQYYTPATAHRCGFTPGHD